MRREFLQYMLILIVFIYASVPETLAKEPNTTHGTAIAAYRTENEIVVAADSRVVPFGGSTSYIEPICKIRQFGDIFVAASGLYKDPASKFDLWEIVSMASTENQKLSSMVESFEPLARDRLKAILWQVKALRPKEFQEKFIKKPPFTVVISGIEDGVPTLKVREFYIISNTDDIFLVNIGLWDCPGNLCLDGKRTAYLIGKIEEDKQKIDETFQTPFLSRDAKCNTVDLARRFVQMMIDKDSVNFGPPIDILSITKHGARWIQKKETCPEIKK
jgi:hypothetical protein